MADHLSRTLPGRLATAALLSLTVVSMHGWWTTLSRVAGGADSYGYISESQLILGGSLVQRPTEIDRLPLDRGQALAVASPLGYVPSLAADGIVPVYPIGLPALMALATLVVGPDAPFYVAPVMGMIGLALVFAIARVWFDPLTAALATAWVAWNPVYIAYAKQPMSDVPAAVLLLAAIYLIVRLPSRPLAAGAATGAALLTRPALIAAALTLAGYGAWRHFANSAHQGSRFQLRFGAVFTLAVFVQLALQTALYGHPLQSGYGSAGLLFALDRLPANLAVYGRWVLATQGWLWLGALALGLLLVRAAEPRIVAVSVAAAAAAPYLLYFEFDHWETLRFVLPGLVVLTVVAAAGLTAALQRLNAPWMMALALVGCGAAFAWQSNRWLDRTGAWRLADAEARYPLAAGWVAQVTPPDAMVMAGQHSGSIRYYASRFTLRWDVLEPEALVPTVRHLNAQQIEVFAAFEGVELDRFRERFRDVLHQVDLLPAGQARGVILVEFRLRAG